MANEAQYDELDLMEIMLILKKYWKMIVIFTFVSLLTIGLVTMFFIQPKYESQVVFELVNSTELRDNDLKNKITNPNYHLELLKGRQFLAGVLNRAGIDFNNENVSQLTESIKVQKR